jgi:hypothetical protein
MKFYFEINKNTLPIITALNDGVEPLLDSSAFFVYDPDIEGHGKILFKGDVLDMQDGWAGSEIILFKE